MRASLDALGLLSEIMDAQIRELTEMRAAIDLAKIEDKLESHGERIMVLELEQDLYTDLSLE